MQCNNWISSNTVLLVFYYIFCIDVIGISTTNSLHLCESFSNHCFPILSRFSVCLRCTLLPVNYLFVQMPVLMKTSLACSYCVIILWLQEMPRTHQQCLPSPPGHSLHSVGIMRIILKQGSSQNIGISSKHRDHLKILMFNRHYTKPMSFNPRPPTAWNFALLEHVCNIRNFVFA